MSKFILQIVLLISLTLAQVLPAAALSIGFSPTSPIAATAGNNFNVDIVVSGLTAGNMVSAYNLDVLYDATKLSSNPLDISIIFGSALGNAALVEVLEGVDKSVSGNVGRVNFAALSLLSDLELQTLLGANSSVTLATLTFKSIVTEPVNLAFDWFPGRDVKGAANTPILGYGAPAVPEPGTFLLLGSGALSAWGLRRRKKLIN